MGRGRARWRAVGTLAAVVVLTLLAACADDGGGSEAGPPAPRSPLTVDPSVVDGELTGFRIGELEPLPRVQSPLVRATVAVLADADGGREGSWAVSFELRDDAVPWVAQHGDQVDVGGTPGYTSTYGSALREDTTAVTWAVDDDVLATLVPLDRARVPVEEIVAVGARLTHDGSLDVPDVGLRPGDDDLGVLAVLGPASPSGRLTTQTDVTRPGRPVPEGESDREDWASTSLALVPVTPDEQAAYRLLQFTDPAEQLRTATSCCPTAATVAPRRLEVGGRDASVGTVDTRMVAVVVEGDPGVVALVPADYFVPPPPDDELVALLETVRPVDEARAQELAAEAEDDRHDRWLAEVRPLLPGDAEVVLDGTFAGPSGPFGPSGPEDYAVLRTRLAHVSQAAFDDSGEPPPDLGLQWCLVVGPSASYSGGSIGLQACVPDSAWRSSPTATAVDAELGSGIGLSDGRAAEVVVTYENGAELPAAILPLDLGPGEPTQVVVTRPTLTGADGNEGFPTGVVVRDAAGAELARD